MSGPRTTRRRFLAIGAAAACLPGAAAAAPVRWTGVALGAEASITVRAPEPLARAAIADALRVIRGAERRFSLHDPGSDLSRLNAAGRLDRPHRDMLRLLRLAGRAHLATGGLFDPTVQPLWRALAEGGDVAAARAAIGWERVGISPARIVLGAGQALTLNGIAQGFATDAVADALASHGLGDVLAHVGEHAARGGPWRLGLVDPAHGMLGTRTLRAGALATSSPAATPLGAHGHVIHPRLGAVPARWSTVCVEAEGAGWADALSTALCHADRAAAEGVRALPGVRAVTLVDLSGDLVTL